MIATIKDLREAIADLADHDQVCVENEDLYPFYVDVIEGITLINGDVVREVRFCVLDNTRENYGNPL